MIPESNQPCGGLAGVACQGSGRGCMGGRGGTYRGLAAGEIGSGPDCTSRACGWSVEGAAADPGGAVGVCMVCGGI